jgi:hypothetical protein
MSHLVALLSELTLLTSKYACHVKLLHIFLETFTHLIVFFVLFIIFFSGVGLCLRNIVLELEVVEIMMKLSPSRSKP